MSESSTGLDPKVGGLLCYLLGWITGIVFLILEKTNGDIPFVPVIGGLVGIVVGPLSLILWIVLMVKAFQGERFKLPVVGDWAEEQV